jgi:hypothetical protein
MSLAENAQDFGSLVLYFSMNLIRKTPQLFLKKDMTCQKKTLIGMIFDTLCVKMTNKNHRCALNKKIIMLSSVLKDLDMLCQKFQNACL